MAVRIPCPECRAVTLLKDDGFQKLYIRAECPICKEQRPSPFRGFQCGHVVCDACYGELAARGFADGRETPTHVPRTEGNVPVPGEVSVGPVGPPLSVRRSASVGGYATEDPDVTPDPYDLGNVRNFERPGTSYEGGSRSDGMGATTPDGYVKQVGKKRTQPSEMSGEGIRIRAERTARIFPPPRPDGSYPEKEMTVPAGYDRVIYEQMYRPTSMVVQFEQFDLTQRFDKMMAMLKDHSISATLRAHMNMTDEDIVWNIKKYEGYREWVEQGRPVSIIPTSPSGSPSG